MAIFNPNNSGTNLRLGNEAKTTTDEHRTRHMNLIKKNRADKYLENSVEINSSTGQDVPAPCRKKISNGLSYI